MTNPNNGFAVDRSRPDVLDGTVELGIDLEDLEARGAPELARITRQLATSLDRCTEYSQRMWRQLDLLATFLREEAAPRGAGPSGPDEATRVWVEAYRTTLSLLAGPRGDSGFGAEQAQLELQNRGDRPHRAEETKS